jgi:hypothetical protein
MSLAVILSRVRLGEYLLLRLRDNSKLNDPYWKTTVIRSSAMVA